MFALINCQYIYIYIHLRRSRDDAVFVRSCVVRVFLTLDSFSSLWAAFSPTVHITTLYNEIVLRKEQHTSGINTIP